MRPKQSLTTRTRPSPWIWFLVFSPPLSALASLAISVLSDVYDWRLMALTLLVGLMLGYLGLRAVWRIRSWSVRWALRLGVSLLVILVTVIVGIDLVTAARDLRSGQAHNPVIAGSVAPGYEEVWSEFERNFRVRGEWGAACAAYVDGQKVVDIWGGFRDLKRSRAWEKDTLALVFSTTKGMAAMTLAVANSRGWLDYDAKVASYWPEFAAEGKQDVTVRQLLSHQAGLCCLDVPLTLDELRDPDRIARQLALQKPVWPPGASHGYHALSIGLYEEELLRRVDPQRRTLGRFFQDEIAKPLAIEFYIGLPHEVPASRLARLSFFPATTMAFNVDGVPWRFILSLLRPRSLAARAMANPRLEAALLQYERPEYRGIEEPSANGVGTARSIARAYSAFATGGAELGLQPDTLDKLAAAPITPPAGDTDLVLGVPFAYSLGYAKPSVSFRFGTNSKAFGTPGMGGSVGFADPEVHAAFAYVPNRLGYCLVDDPREKPLRDAFYRCLRRVRKGAK
jgi:CubicO group peptidase (beta-lactamase class C family)